MEEIVETGYSLLVLLEDELELKRAVGWRDKSGLVAVLVEGNQD